MLLTENQLLPFRFGCLSFHACRSNLCDLCSADSSFLLFLECHDKLLSQSINCRFLGAISNYEETKQIKEKKRNGNLLTV